MNQGTLGFPRNLGNGNPEDPPWFGVDQICQSNYGPAGNVWYQNTDNKPIYVGALITSSPIANYASLSISKSVGGTDPVLFYGGSSAGQNNYPTSCGGIVPPGWWFQVSTGGGTLNTITVFRDPKS